MSQHLSTLPLASAGDIVVARQHARRLAEMLGLDRQGQTRIATAVSEIARNAYTHGGGGEVEFAVALDAKPELFSVVVRDQGPGIAELDAVLTGRKQFPPGRGAGLVNARRLVDELQVLRSAPGGTEVRLSQRIPRSSAARLTAPVLDSVARAQPARRADPLDAVHEQNRELADSLTALQERQDETARLNRELEDTNRGVVALYSELEQKAEQLRSVSDLKSRFLSHMSHEFRTPLNSILALSRLLLDRVDGELTAEQLRQVDYIRKSAQGLLEMVNDLLDLAKVEAGRMDVRATPVDVPTLFAALRGSLKPLLVNAAVELVFEPPPPLPEIVTDEQKVAQVLRNFIANALRFTERGHVNVQVRHDAARARIVFAVEDTGIGIAPQALEGIFEEFAQIDGRLQRGGTGLGLPLSRRLAQLMGGDITARSQPGVGSTFELFIPERFGQSPVPDDAARADASGQVLVIDDEETFRYVIRHIAQDAGLQVIDAADGDSGLRLARAHRPDVVILDLHMPGVDGFAVLDALARADAAGPPVIVCTSQLLSVDQKRALAAAYAIVPKHELSRDGLTALLNHAVNRNKDRP